jgi:hypothetical protein
LGLNADWDVGSMRRCICIFDEIEMEGLGNDHEDPRKGLPGEVMPISPVEPVSLHWLQLVADKLVHEHQVKFGRFVAMLIVDRNSIVQVF